MSDQEIPQAEHAEAPVGINHVVFNVRDIEESEKFWTEIMGFTRVGQLKANPGFRFYSGKINGEVNHHDLALVQCENPIPPPVEDWSMRPARMGPNHIAVSLPDRASWLKQIAWLQQNGVKFHLRLNHGMTHSVYISDPDGYGIEVLYELPREIWQDHIDEGLNYAEFLPTEGPEALVDSTDYHRFDEA